MDDSLTHLAQQYRAQGILTPADLLLPPRVAIALLSEPALKVVMVLGCQGWRTQEGELDAAVAVPEAVYYAETHVPYIDIWPQLSADLVKRYLREQDRAGGRDGGTIAPNCALAHVGWGARIAYFRAIATSPAG